MVTDVWNIQAWYATTGLLALIHYWPSGDQVSVRIRPWGIPTAALQCLRRWSLFLWGLLAAVSGMLVMFQPCADMIGLRFCFAALMAGLDLNFFSARRVHTSFIGMYNSFAMVLPASYGRSGVLTILLAHQFLSPGLSKVRVGGLRWLSAETLACYLRNARNAPNSNRLWNNLDEYFRQGWLIDRILERS
ncbi:unnamed protein product [Prorocentrum cordatum]|uniref:Uncharacterized protein n=1 Tax=Prorocentrum cordatum TaxID=2364126 RepID=A0ABN9RWV0_9DINO|nr:unnamed protein product [Polarella glacialis]